MTKVEHTTIVDETVDLEEYANAEKHPPRARHYIIRIDNKRYTVDVSAMTGRELLRLAEKDPTENSVYQKFRGGKMEKIELDEKVDFTKPGIERFCTLPLDQTEGG